MTELHTPTEPLPCPFCGVSLVANTNLSDLHVRRYGTHYDHPLDPCFLAGAEVSPCEVESWNRRAAIATTKQEPKHAP